MIYQSHDDAALTVVMAAKGYPGRYHKGTIIDGLEQFSGDEEVVKIFHAGTKRDENGAILASGGRVLGVTAMANTIAEAQREAYAAADAIDWPDGFYRRDIGWRALDR